MKPVSGTLTLMIFLGALAGCAPTSSKQSSGPNTDTGTPAAASKATLQQLILEIGTWIEEESLTESSETDLAEKLDRTFVIQCKQNCEFRKRDER